MNKRIFRLNKDGSSKVVFALTMFLVISAIFSLSGLFKLSSWGISLRTMIAFVFILNITTLLVKRRVEELFSFRYSSLVYIFFASILVSMSPNIIENGFYQFDTMQRNSGSFLSIRFFSATILLTILLIKVLNGFNKIDLFLKIVCSSIIVAASIARLSVLGINTRYYAFYSQNTDIREEGLISYSITKIGSQLVNRETFLWLDTNTYANILVIGIIILVYYFMRSNSIKQKTLISFAFIITSSSLLATYSRGTFFQLIAGGIILVLFSKSSTFSKKKFQYLITLGIIVALTFLYPKNIVNYSFRINAFIDLVLRSNVASSIGGDFEGAAISRYITAAKAYYCLGRGIKERYSSSTSGYSG